VGNPELLTFAEKFCFLCTEIMADKNKLYGSAIDFTGLLGGVLECVIKSLRLREMVMRDGLHGRGEKEAIWDTLLDLHNYTIIAAYMLEQENWEGR
jgi:hypothetical protein